MKHCANRRWNISKFRNFFYCFSERFTVTTGRQKWYGHGRTSRTDSNSPGVNADCGICFSVLRTCLTDKNSCLVKLIIEVVDEMSEAHTDAIVGKVMVRLGELLGEKISWHRVHRERGGAAVIAQMSGRAKVELYAICRDHPGIMPGISITDVLPVDGDVVLSMRPPSHDSEKTASGVENGKNCFKVFKWQMYAHACKQHIPPPPICTHIHTHLPFFFSFRLPLPLLAMCPPPPPPPPPPPCKACCPLDEECLSQHARGAQIA